MKVINAVNISDNAVYRRTFYNAALSVGLNNKSAAQHNDSVQISDMAKEMLDYEAVSTPANTEETESK